MNTIRKKKKGGGVIESVRSWEQNIMSNNKTSMIKRCVALILAVAITIGPGGAVSVSAWTGPTATPPNNNVPAPVNVGGDIQAKTADFYDFSKVHAGAFCLWNWQTNSESCIDVTQGWPNGGGGGGGGLPGGSSTGQVLTWNNTTQTWSAQPLPANLPTGSNNNTLFHNATGWLANSALQSDGTRTLINPNGGGTINTGIALETDATNNVPISLLSNGYSVLYGGADIETPSVSIPAIIGLNSSIKVPTAILTNKTDGPALQIPSGHPAIGKVLTAVTPDGQVGWVTPVNGSTLPNGTSTGQVLTWNGTTWIAQVLPPSNSGLPAGNSYDTLYHDGTNWVVNPTLKADGSNVTISQNGSAPDPSTRLVVSADNDALSIGSIGNNVFAYGKTIFYNPHIGGNPGGPALQVIDTSSGQSTVGKVLGAIDAQGTVGWITPSSGSTIPNGTSTGQVLTWDNANQTWVAQVVPTQIPVGPANNTLYSDGTNWKNNASVLSDGTTALINPQSPIVNPLPSVGLTINSPQGGRALATVGGTNLFTSTGQPALVTTTTTGPSLRVSTQGSGPALSIISQNAGAGKVLMSDASGNADWATAPTGLPNGVNYNTLYYDGQSGTWKNNSKLLSDGSTAVLDPSGYYTTPYPTVSLLVNKPNVQSGIPIAAAGTSLFANPSGPALWVNSPSSGTGKVLTSLDNSGTTDWRPLPASQAPLPSGTTTNQTLVWDNSTHTWVVGTVLPTGYQNEMLYWDDTTHQWTPTDNVVTNGSTFAVNPDQSLGAVPNSMAAIYASASATPNVPYALVAFGNTYLYGTTHWVLGTQSICTAVICPSTPGSITGLRLPSGSPQPGQALVTANTLGDTKWGPVPQPLLPNGTGAGQFLNWNGSAWVPGVNGTANGQVLVWNNTSHTWTVGGQYNPGIVGAAQIDNTTRYNGTNWVPQNNVASYANGSFEIQQVANDSSAFGSLRVIKQPGANDTKPVFTAYRNAGGYKGLNVLNSGDTYIENSKLGVNISTPTTLLDVRGSAATGTTNLFKAVNAQNGGLEVASNGTVMTRGGWLLSNSTLNTFSNVAYFGPNLANNTTTQVTAEKNVGNGSTNVLEARVYDANNALPAIKGLFVKDTGSVNVEGRSTGPTDSLFKVTPKNGNNNVGGIDVPRSGQFIAWGNATLTQNAWVGGYGAGGGTLTVGGNGYNGTTNIMGADGRLNVGTSSTNPLDGGTVHINGTYQQSGKIYDDYVKHGLDQTYFDGTSSTRYVPLCADKEGLITICKSRGIQFYWMNSDGSQSTDGDLVGGSPYKFTVPVGTTRIRAYLIGGGGGGGGGGRSSACAPAVLCAAGGGGGGGGESGQQVTVTINNPTFGQDYKVQIGRAGHGGAGQQGDGSCGNDDYALWGSIAAGISAVPYIGGIAAPFILLGGYLSCYFSGDHGESGWAGDPTTFGSAQGQTYTALGGGGGHGGEQGQISSGGGSGGGNAGDPGTGCSAAVNDGCNDGEYGHDKNDENGGDGGKGGMSGIGSEDHNPWIPQWDGGGGHWQTAGGLHGSSDNHNGTSGGDGSCLPISWSGMSTNGCGSGGGGGGGGYYHSAHRGSGARGGHGAPGLVIVLWD